VWAFDLLERDGEDLRDLPLERRKDELKVLLKRTLFGLALNDYVAGDGPALFAQVCAMGPRGHRVEAAGLALPVRALVALAQGEERYRSRNASEPSFASGERK
jgi:hypothetical protein